MEKMVKCEHWKEYRGLNGWVMFCGVGAYGKLLTVEEARSCGCTGHQRARCKKIMETNVGFGLVPDIMEEAVVEIKRAAGEPLVSCRE